MKVNSSNLRVLMGIILCAVAWVGSSTVVQAQAAGHTATPSQAQPQTQAQTQPPAQAQAPPPQPENLTTEQLQQIVAPIALYPDALVAQILAGSAYPLQIGAAARFIQQNPTLKDAELGAAVDKQTWDPSVKALTQFPSVLSNMNKNQDWTARLGQANVNQQGEVVDAIQVMRQKAMVAGNLQTSPQQTVTKQEKIIVIQPANPQIVYVPEYDPGLVYGYRVGLWAGFHPWWGVWGGGPFMRWGLGFGIGPWGGFGWGWHAWGFNWAGRGLFYGGHPYAYNRAAYARGYAHGVAAANRGNANGNRGQAGTGRNGQSGSRSGNQTGNKSGTQSGSRSGGQSGTRSGTSSSGTRGGTGKGSGSSKGGRSGGSGSRGGRSGGGGHAGGGHAGGHGRG